MLFEFTRHNQHYIDAPKVSIKVGSGCPAGCKNCEFSYEKIQSNIEYSLESIKDNIKKVDEQFSKRFEIFLVGIDLIKSEVLEDIIYLCNNLGRKVKLQLSHKITDAEIFQLEELLEKMGAIDCSIALMVHGSHELGHIIKLIKRFSALSFSSKVFFDLFIDTRKHQKIINRIITGLGTEQSHNEYNCIVGESFDIKFHDLSWEIDELNKKISSLTRETCMMKDYFNIQDGIIFLDDHIEVFPNGDLVFHENLCYLGNYKISNIHKPTKAILDNFISYSEYLYKINSGVDQGKNCYACIKNPFKY